MMPAKNTFFILKEYFISKLNSFLLILTLLLYSSAIDAQHIQALQNQDGRMEVFTTGFHIYQLDQGSTWSDWRNFGTSTPIFYSLAGKKKDGALFMIKLNLEIIHTCYQVIPNGSWDYVSTALITGLFDSSQMDDGGNFTYVANPDGTITFFMLGYDHSCWWIDKINTTGYQGYKNFGGHDLKFITAATNQDGRNELFAIGGNKMIYHRWQTTVGGDWNGWQPLGGRDVRSITTAMNADGRLEVFAIGGNNVIYSISQAQAGGSFGDWRTIGGKDIQQIVATPNQDGRLEVFALGSDEVVYSVGQVVPNGSFGHWNNLGGSKIKAISATKDRNGRLTVFVIGGNSLVYYKSQVIAGGSWPTDWNNLGAPSSNTASSLPIHPSVPTPPAISASFTTNPPGGYISIGSNANIIWNVQNCGSSCIVNIKGWNGLGYSQQILNKNVAASGQMTIQPTETNTKYTLTAAGTNGSINKTVTIAWAPNSGTLPPPCTYFYFKMTGSSSVTPCFMIAVCAKDLATAKAKAENESGGYIATQVSAQEYTNGCN